MRFPLALMGVLLMAGVEPPPTEPEPTEPDPTPEPSNGPGVLVVGRRDGWGRQPEPAFRPRVGTGGSNTEHRPRPSRDDAADRAAIAKAEEKRARKAQKRREHAAKEAS